MLITYIRVDNISITNYNIKKIKILKNQIKICNYLIDNNSNNNIILNNCYLLDIKYINKIRKIKCKKSKIGRPSRKQELELKNQIEKLTRENYYD